MAMAAAHFQTGEDAAERAALEWLEQQPAPQIKAPTCDVREAVTQFVPVNDVAGPATAPIQSVTGFSRKRQPREFAKAWVGDDSVFLFWPDANVGQHFDALERLCRKVTRVGHSTSLVQMWASNYAPNPPVNWIPDEARASVRFRVTGPGSLGYLERQFNRTEVDRYFNLLSASADGSSKKQQREAKLAIKEDFAGQTPTRLRPELSLTHGYTSEESSDGLHVPGTVFDPHLLVFALEREDGPYRHLDITATLALTSAVRKAILAQVGTDIPEVLSGHRGEQRSELPHIAILPLPFVGREHAHGGILGLAIAVPRSLGERDRTKLLVALGGIRRDGLFMGALGKWRLETSDGTDTLRDRVWTGYSRGARQWATVTPYVLDRHSKNKDRAAYQAELADAIRQSWERVRESSEISVDVIVTPVSPHLGTAAAHEFPRLQRKDGSECRHIHAILIFSEPVVGPLLLGAGRYRGYGIFRPLHGEGV